MILLLDARINRAPQKKQFEGYHKKNLLIQIKDLFLKNGINK
jgi:hypothetical protein